MTSLIRRRFGRWGAKSLAIALVALLATAALAVAANISGNGTLIGTSGNDNIAAGNGNDTVYGLGGSDNITAGTGNDVIDGGGKCGQGVTAGVYPNGFSGGQYCEHGPVAPCGTDNITIASGSGDDTIWGNCGPNNITLGKGQGNDTVYAYGGPNNIGPNNGDDHIYLYDTAGGSTVATGTGSNVVYAQNGVADTIYCGSKATVVYADSIDKTKNCTVKYSRPPRSADVVAASHTKTTTKAKKTGSKRTHHTKKHAKHAR